MLSVFKFLESNRNLKIFIIKKWILKKMEEYKKTNG